MIEFIVGLVIGVYIGVGTMCLMVINKDRGEDDE